MYIKTWQAFTLFALVIGTAVFANYSIVYKRTLTVEVACARPAMLKTDLAPYLEAHEALSRL